VEDSHFSAVEAAEMPCVEAGTKMMVVEAKDTAEEEEEE